MKHGCWEALNAVSCVGANWVEGLGPRVRDHALQDGRWPRRPGLRGRGLAPCDGPRRELLRLRRGLLQRRERGDARARRSKGAARGRSYRPSTRHGDGTLTADDYRNILEQSLSRFDIDYLDVHHMHGLDWETAEKVFAKGMAFTAPARRRKRADQAPGVFLPRRPEAHGRHLQGRARHGRRDLPVQPPRPRQRGGHGRGARDGRRRRGDGPGRGRPPRRPIGEAAGLAAREDREHPRAGPSFRAREPERVRRSFRDEHRSRWSRRTSPPPATRQR